MTLTILARNPAAPHAAPIRAAMSTERFVVGRSPECDLVLPDPEKILSKRHCILERRGADYTLTDTSTNGTFLNYGADPLGAGSTPLSQGDVIVIGQYELVIDIAPAALPVEPELPELDTGQGPFDAPYVSGPAPQGLASLEENDEAGDFLDDLLGAPASADPLGPPRDLGASIPDHVPAAQAHFAPPQTSAPMIPDDWEDSLIAPQPEPSAEPAMPAPVAPASAPPDARPSEDALLRAFLAGAGAAHLQLSGPEAEQIMRRAGRIMAATIEGLRDILMTRSALKSEMRVNRTMIQAQANNPLKFSVSKEQAIEAMLKPTTPGYLDPEAAVDEALRDIKAHEIATMTGMDAALKHLLAQLGPDNLAARIEQNSGVSARFGSKKARYWDAYAAHYAQIANATETDFQSTFGREFSRAYENQINKL